MRHVGTYGEQLQHADQLRVRVHALPRRGRVGLEKEGDKVS